MKKILNSFEGKKLYSLNMNINSDGGNIKILYKIFQIYKIIKQISPDIVNAHYITSYGFISSIIKVFFNLKYKLIFICMGK